MMNADMKSLPCFTIMDSAAYSTSGRSAKQ
jgi:hypothetical protein